MADIELTPSLLHFYRSKINELQQQQYTISLNRLKHLELSANERTTLERQVSEYQNEMEITKQDVDELQGSLIRERRAVIELVQENAKLRGTREYFTDKFMKNSTIP